MRTAGNQSAKSREQSTLLPNGRVRITELLPADNLQPDKMRFLYLRYVNWVFRSQELAAFPETVEGRNNRAGYNAIEDLESNKVLI